MKKLLFIIITFMLLNVSAYAYENNGELTSITATAGTVSIAEDPEDSTNSVIKLEASSEAFLFIPIEKINGGVIELSYKIRFTSQGNNIIQLPMLTANKNYIYTPQLHQNYLAINNSGNMKHFGPCNPDRWHTLKFVTDTESMKYDVYFNGRKICSNFGFTTAVMSEVDGIKMRLVSGTVWLDDISVVRTGDGGERTILFNSSYSVNHNDYTIGYLPYKMTKTNFLNSLKLKNGVNVSLSSIGNYINNGDNLTLYDTLYDNTYNYRLIVRTPNISKSFYNEFKNSLVLKENNEFYYSGGQFIEGDGYVNGVVVKEALNNFGIDSQSSKTVSELKNMGFYVKAYKDGYIIIKKSPYTYANIFTHGWYYDLQKLFLGGAK